MMYMQNVTVFRLDLPDRASESCSESYHRLQAELEGKWTFHLFHPHLVSYSPCFNKKIFLSSKHKFISRCKIFPFGHKPRAEHPAFPATLPHIYGLGFPHLCAAWWLLKEWKFLTELWVLNQWYFRPSPGGTDDFPPEKLRGARRWSGRLSPDIPTLPPPPLWWTRAKLASHSAVSREEGGLWQRRKGGQVVRWDEKAPGQLFERR